ncbi:MAG: NGG1p interacting factor NIF3 [Spirochaetales bacterium]|nr:NGG1p interacting factor NIF3 [Spirochaetales bacterium]
MYKLEFYVPENYCEEVKSAVFAAGAGTQGNYCQCCWQVLGDGQFLPMQGSKPFVGKVGVPEKVREMKVEMICDDEFIHDAVAALKKAHPYEEPAYSVLKISDIDVIL